MAEAEQVKNDSDDEVFGVATALLEDVLGAVERGDAAAVDALLSPEHPADIANLLELIDDRKRSDLLRLWRGDGAGEVLSELDDVLREEVIDSLAPADLALSLIHI